MGGRRDFKESTAQYERKCFSCKRPVRPGERCFLAPPNGRRYWSMCCMDCAEERGWTVDRENPAKTYPEEPPGGWWWQRD
jgi:hypothetical protein